MPALSSKLPQYTGPYSVGVIDVESPCDGRTTCDIEFKDSGEPAFKLDTVLFSLYYPSVKGAKSSNPKHLWVPKPISLTGEGYARFAHMDNFLINHVFTLGLWTLAGSTTIPANVDVPLRDTSIPGISAVDPDDEISLSEDSTGLPVIIFSHGMASSRTDYTHFCGEMASRGYVVAAIEHRDGSGPGTVVMKDKDSITPRPHFGLNDLQHVYQLDVSMLKEAQLDFRQAEIQETVRVLRMINDGQGEIVFQLNPRSEGQYMKSWQGRFAMDNITMAGHSYGATGALQALKGAPSKELPIYGGIILDPGKSSGPLNHDIDVPILVIHSSSWSKKHSIFFGQPHFDVVKDLVQGVLDQGKDAWFMTSLGTSHPSVTDAPLIEPILLSWTTGSTIPVQEGVNVYVEAAEQFLLYQKTGKRTGLLNQPVTHPTYNEPIGEGKMDRNVPEEVKKYWQIHVAPAPQVDSSSWSSMEWEG